MSFIKVYIFSELTKWPKTQPGKLIKKSSVNSFSGKCFHLLINEKTSCVIAFEKKKPATKNIKNKLVNDFILQD